MASENSTMADTVLIDMISNIDSQFVAKLWACIIFLAGFAWIVASDKMVDQYVTERKGNVEAQNMILEAMGGACLATSVASLCMLLYPDGSMDGSMDAIKAIGYMGAAWCLIAYKWILQGTFFKANKNQQAGAFFASILTAYAGLYQTEWADSVFRMLILVFTLAAIAGVISPSLGVQIWYGAVEEDKYPEHTEFCMKGMSFFLLAQELHNYLLLQGIAPDKSLAYATFPMLCHFISALYIGKEARWENVKATGYYVWMGIDVTMIALILSL